MTSPVIPSPATPSPLVPQGVPSNPLAPDPLAALTPNIVPDPIGWFPLAPGWWLLIALTIALVTLATVGLVRYYRRNAYRRRALRELEFISQAFEHHQDMKQLAKECNHLLKATALQVWPREPVAPLHGDEWLAFLDHSAIKKHGNNGDSFCKGSGTVLGHALYNKTGPEPQSSATDLLQLVKHWLKNHKVTGGQHG